MTAPAINPQETRTMFRFWRMHFTTDPASHWLNIDCGEPVTEKRAVQLAERATAARGPVTSAVPDFPGSPEGQS